MKNVTVKEIADYIESFAPLSMQENYDNAGLIVGATDMNVSNVLVCLDSTEEVVEEAIRRNCNMIVAHHPIVFKGLKKINGKNYVERVVIKCIQNNIALYACHTNLDNYNYGVNYEISQRLQLKNSKILQAKDDVLMKLVVFTPPSDVENVSHAIFQAGGGKIDQYENCSFSSEGIGSFKPIGNANPTVGQLNETTKTSELRLEFIVSSHLMNKVVYAMKMNHSYEEVAYDIIPMKNANQTEGAGMIGELENEVDELEFLKSLKQTFKMPVIQHTKLLNKAIKKVAFCGGAGSFLLQNAIQQNADVFITSDMKYHEFFDAENKIVIVNIGHFESEQFTINLLADYIQKKFLTFAVYLTETNTNPINYL